jgi:hypothetical protein
MQDSSTRIADDICAEGTRLARGLREANLPARLVGGVAVWLRSPSVREDPLKRNYGDLDLAAASSARSSLTKFLEQEGYTPDKRFNALHGASRLIFVDGARSRRIDVILDRFSMCHTIDLRGRMAGDEDTIPLADLLLTKLQIFELNEKDLRDILALLADHAIGPAPDEIDPKRIADLTRGDWGLEHTVRRTLDQVRERAGWPGLDSQTVHVIRTRVDEITHVLDTTPKSARWKMRDRVGERIRWYELPEEVR